MRCPSCGSRLVEVERSEILIDACPECRGVWLDRGELDKILVRERRLAAGHEEDEDFFREVEGRRRPEGAHGEEPPRRRRRSFLEDLLDFD
jgi:Zn-finger nucleic acid-binding protein